MPKTNEGQPNEVERHAAEAFSKAFLEKCTPCPRCVLLAKVLRAERESLDAWRRGSYKHRLVWMAARAEIGVLHRELEERLRLLEDLGILEKEAPDGP